MLTDIDKDTVSYAPNFDGSREEPTVLPSMAIGLGVAWLISPFFSLILLGNDARSPATFSLVATLFLGVTLLVSLRPALTASRVEPVDVLRSE